MWLRSALTSLLAAMLLCVSCAASTCSMQCELSVLQPTGHTTHQHDAAAPGESDRDHCGHVRAAQVGAAQIDAELAMLGRSAQLQPQCRGKLCMHDQAGTLAGSGSDYDQRTAVLAETTPASIALIVRPLASLSGTVRLANPPPRYSDALRL